MGRTTPDPHHVVAGLEVDRVDRGYVHELLHVKDPTTLRRQRGHLFAVMLTNCPGATS